MDLLLTGIFSATVNFADILINVIAVEIGMNVIEIGLLNAAWVFFYVFSLRFFEKLHEARKTKTPLVYSVLPFFISGVLTYVSLQFRETSFIYLAYIFHAVSSAASNIGINSYVLEAYSSLKWQKALSTRNTYSQIIEATMYMMCYLVGIDFLLPNYLLLIALLVSMLVLIALRLRLTMSIPERTLFRIEKQVSQILRPAKGLYYLTSLQDYGIATGMASWYVRRSSIFIPLLSIAGLKLGNEFLLTPLPYILLKSAGLSGNVLMIIYSLGKFVSGVSLVLLGASLYSTRLTRWSTILRLLALPGIFLVKSPIILGLLLGLFYTVSVILELNTYWLYINITAGESISTYSAVSASSSLVGSLLSGGIYALSGVGGLVVANIMVLLPVFAELREMRHIEW